MIRLLLALLCLMPSIAHARQGEAPTPASSAPVAIAPPKITLLDPGAEPRQALRFRIAPNHQQTVKFKMTMASGMSMGGSETPETRMPAVVMIMKLAVKAIAENGDITYVMSIAEADVEPGPGDPEEMVDVLRESIKPVMGLRGLCTVSNRGVTQSISIEMPKSTGEEGSPPNPAAMQGFREQVDQAMFPLPEEPIGKGARWTVENENVTQTIRLNQKVTYTLTDHQGDAVACEVAIEQSAGEQELKSPGMPKGTSITLRSLKSEGKGSIETLLTLLAPKRSEGTLKSVMDAIVGQGGLGMGMKQSTTVEVQITDVSAIDAPATPQAPTEPGK